MKYYLKFFWVGVASGSFCILAYAMQINPFYLSELVSWFGMKYVDCFAQYLMDIVYWYLPLLFFQIFFGTYVYRHFCTASIYFFSRYTKRTSWYIKESGMLFFMGVLYLLAMLGGAMVCSALLSDIVWDVYFAEKLFFYICIYSLFLFVSTLGINIVAILSNSNMGFIIVEGVIMFFIAVFSLTGQFFVPAGYELEQYEWLLKINPFYYLVFGMKYESIDYLVAIVVYFVLAIVVWLLGCVAINKRDFIGGNSEVGGI